MLLEAKNIHKKFGSHEILKDISLSVDAGEVAVILGPSGAGKTTLLRCLNFLETPDEGTRDQELPSADSFCVSEF